ncbi:SRPBCC family protein [Streptomyces sp. AK02-01A]|uniref:SRPBCC family protein n=1 Tax=Streptomyces sp. AK02-01A TaxID=3028648 RepID=UPI0029BF60CF|nr:SRPBCC family protein [Streptomyces sp. AK02-01A]MDX3853390.1 SRPBCC family protein [Streptomyces sp. AK02-01A]
MTHHNKDSADRLARGLGWFSATLGLTRTTVPHAVCRLSGVDDSTWARTLMPVLGVRELGQGALLLGSRRPAPWVWTRIAGDALDLTLLVRALRSRTGGRQLRVMAATAAVSAITGFDLYTAVRSLGRSGPRRSDSMHTHASVTVNRPRSEVYRYWHAFENLPDFMSHLEAVRADGDGQSHWIAKAPVKKRVEWDAEVALDRPGELIAWRSLKGADVDNAGSVSFQDAPGGQGTEVRVELDFTPPGGKAGAAVARLLGEHPEQQIHDDLRRFKQVMEVGEVVRSEGSSEGTHTWRPGRQHPAQPHHEKL